MYTQRLFTVLIWLSLCVPTLAGLYDPPADYYLGATGTGASLRSQLTTIMSTGHILRSYGDFRNSAIIHDADPNQPGNILLVYNRASVSGTWDSGSTWNREHVWPQSLQPGSASNSTRGNLGDPHALRPANPSINTSRSNKPYGVDDTTGTFGAIGTDYFPSDADKGDIARQLFYSETRYAGLSLVEGAPQSNQMGDLSSLIAWHFLDPPDEFELRRNHAIYSSELNPSYYTNNRNAYVDRPEYVWSVYVDQFNDSQIAINGAAIAEDGATSAVVDLGRVLVGAAVPDSQLITLDKHGSDGTYYQVTTAGNATSSVVGRYNAFSSGGTDSTSFDVGLSTSTSTAGQRSGTVTIDNLDVTSGAGAGRGDNDANDLLAVTLDVLNHAEPSFNGVSDQNLLTFDFGSIAVGASEPTFSFSIFNLEETANFTAALDLDEILGTGDTGTLKTDLATFSDLDAGQSSVFTANLDTAVPGVFSAAYTLSFSDEDISGAMDLVELNLMLTGEVTLLADNADFNANMTVEGEDFLIWQRGLGAGSTLGEGDATGDGAIDAADLAAWEYQYGDTAVGSLETVPEPSAQILALLGSVFWLKLRGQHSRSK